MFKMSACGKVLPFLSQISRIFVHTPDFSKFRTDARFKRLDLDRLKSEAKIRDVVCLLEELPDTKVLTTLTQLGVSLIVPTYVSIELPPNYYFTPYTSSLYPEPVRVYRVFPPFLA